MQNRVDIVTSQIWEFLSQYFSKLFINQLTLLQELLVYFFVEIEQYSEQNIYIRLIQLIELSYPWENKGQPTANAFPTKSCLTANSQKKSDIN